MKKRTKVIVVAIPVLVVLLLIGYLVGYYILQGNLNRVREESYYARRLKVLDAREDVSILMNGEYFTPVQVGEKIYYYDTATAYVNWRNYCSETNDETMTYETFIQALLDPEESKESRAIMKWVDEMNGTVNTFQILKSFAVYLHDESFLEQHPEQSWPSVAEACTIEQLEILYDYHVEQRGW